MNRVQHEITGKVGTAKLSRNPAERAERTGAFMNSFICAAGHPRPICFTNDEPGIMKEKHKQKQSLSLNRSLG